MSFGFGIGDIVSLSCLAWNIYQACKEIPARFDQVSLEVLSLHAVLKEVDEAVKEEDLTLPRFEGLQTVLGGCEKVLEDLKALVKKYERIGSKANRAWDRIGFASTDVTNLRQRLTVNVALLTAFLSSSQIVVEKRLKKFVKELQLGLREGSVITSQSSEIAAAEEEESVWLQFRKELEDVGISGDDFNANKDFIISWIKKAIEEGMFKELSASRRSRILSCISASTDAGLNHHKIGDPIIVTITTPQKSSTDLKLAIAPEEKIPVVTPSVVTNIARPSTSIAKPPTRLLSRKARFIKKVTNPLINYDKELMDATINNKVDRVRPLLKHADPLLVYKGSTAVNRAIEYSSTGVLQILLEHPGVHIDYETQPGETGLIVATRQGKANVMEVLLDYGANIDMMSRKGTNALLIAAQKGRDDIVRLLLSRRAQPDITNKSGSTALQIAAFKGDFRSVLLLIESKAKVDFQDDRGRTALMFAAGEGHTKICTLLLSRGAGPYLSDNAGFTALAYGARNGQFDTCKELLGEERDFCKKPDTLEDSTMNQLNMALLLATKINKPRKPEVMVRRDLCQLLLQYGADINSGAGKQNTALHEAASRNKLPLLQMFLVKGANIDVVNEKGQTPLHLAARNGQTSTLCMLIQRGADIESIDEDGRTVLHHAVLSKTPETVRALMGLGVSNGLDTNAHDLKGITALVLAKEQKCHPNILRVLQGRPWVEHDTGL